MKKLKTRYMVLLGIVIIILAIVVLVNWDEITLPKYKYTDYGYFTGNMIDIEGIYESINEDTYNEIYKELNRQGISPYKHEVIGRFDYIMGDSIWKYKVFGRRTIKDRILLKGEEDYIVSANCPDVYFCRQDILNSFDGEAE